MNQRDTLSKYLNMLLDSTLDRRDKDILFALFVELEEQIERLRARVHHMEDHLASTNRVDAVSRIRMTDD